ncbi:hypothetical protein RD792_009813 [Penstemon davidsonii]|uniref:dolichol kinase n=1 Tax=Penstemon davidsonii TaxID=160366 RepID=A0ABR0D040_9LAMI|nr:hypothetical protein RD792_009813 [Penstemon davidsonii]
MVVDRPGASSGTPLGAVTLPGLMVSRLIQVLRAVSLQEVGIEGFGLVSLYGKMYDGWRVALMSLWVLCHGFAAVKLIQIILHLFPACSSIGESLLVTTGLVIYLGDMLAYTVAKVSATSISPKYISGILVFSFRLKKFCYQIDPWVFHFVFSEPLKRVTLCTYWMVVICLSVKRFYNTSKNSKTERILLRKYYHLMAVSIFVPALIYQPMFLNLALGAALAVFLLMEIIRIWKIWPLGHVVHQFMNAFTDHRDSDLLIVSHFSLLLGCALPIWLSSGFTDRPLASFAGILSLGIGDTMVITVEKTIEGTAAGITSVLAACFVLLPLLAATGYIFTMEWFPLIVAVTISGLLEAYTAQLDNAFIPLVFYSLLCL